MLAGHSLGSAISIIEAATYHDVDGVLVTAMGHHLNALGLAPIAATFVPAMLDPAFGGRALDPGYLTTMAGTRYSLHKPGPNVTAAVSFDEATKDVAAPTELVDAALLGTVTPYTRLVDVPVLTAIASADPTFCGLLATDCGSAASYRSAEAPYYGPAARLRGVRPARLRPRAQLRAQRAEPPRGRRRRGLIGWSDGDDRPLPERRAPRSPRRDPRRTRDSVSGPRSRRKWAYLISTTTYVPLVHADLERPLLEIGRRAVRRAGRPSRSTSTSAERIGARLVALNCVDKSSLQSPWTC